MKFMFPKQTESAENLFDALVLTFILCFLLSYFDVRDLFSVTITAGGDTASHYYTVEYLRNYLLPRGKVSGWCQGNMGGFPILQYYFPLPFLAMVFLSLAMPLQVAFKLVSVSGIFLLPICTYLFFRLLRLSFPIPVIGAAISLAFLLNDGNTMWGGNILSYLAGEFCFGIGFSLSILWLGLLYDTLIRKKNILTCAILLAVIGFCHGYTLLFDGFASLFFLMIPGRFRQNLMKLVQIHALAILLMGFWLIPLLAFLPYTTRFSILWIFYDMPQLFREIFPSIFYPFILLGSIYAISLGMPSRRDFHPPSTPVVFVGYLILCGAGLYGIGYRLGVVDVRFLPFFQFFLIGAGALIFTRFVRYARTVKIIAAAMMVLASLLWMDAHESPIRTWSRFNYEGFEKKLNWQVFSETNAFLKGTMQNPRVVYEHSLIHDNAGTVRAFESLPLFSGRSTLEGVYIQASLNSPFIFYLQSEISQQPSTPIPDYNYSRFDLNRGIAHFSVFNIREFIVAENKTHEAAARNPSLQRKAAFGPYSIYAFTEAPNRYVEPVYGKPLLIPTKDWKKQSYLWFRLGNLSIPLVFKDDADRVDRSRFCVLDRYDPERAPAEPVENAPPIRETVAAEEIRIDGAFIGKPLWIKISYHPNWKVEGADRIYMASPAFMLIYPDSTHVRLYYGKTWPDYLGVFLTLLGLSILIGSRFVSFRSRLSSVGHGYRWGVRIVSAAMVAVLVLLIYYLITHVPEYPTLSYNKGVNWFDQKDYPKAREMFRKVMDTYSQTIAADDAGFMYAMSYYRENDWEHSLDALAWLLKTYPETRKAGEACYHLGLCSMQIGRKDDAIHYFERTVRDFPTEIWAEQAMDRLKDLQGQ